MHSQRILLALTQAGVSREDAYRLVQRNAMKVWDGYRTGAATVDFLEELLSDADDASCRRPRSARSLGYHLKRRHDLRPRLRLNAGGDRNMKEPRRAIRRELS